MKGMTSRNDRGFHVSNSRVIHHYDNNDCMFVAICSSYSCCGTFV